MLNIIKQRTMEQTVIKAELHKAFVFLLETLSLEHKNSTFTTESIDAINEVTAIIAESNLNPKEDYSKELTKIQRIISKHVTSIINRELTELIALELQTTVGVFINLDITYAGDYYYDIVISTDNYSFKNTIVIKNSNVIMYVVNDLFIRAKYVHKAQNEEIEDI